jgi:hypothetical protein
MARILAQEDGTVGAHAHYVEDRDGDKGLPE